MQQNTAHYKYSHGSFTQQDTLTGQSTYIGLNSEMFGQKNKMSKQTQTWMSKQDIHVHVAMKAI